MSTATVNKLDTHPLILEWPENTTLSKSLIKHLAICQHFEPDLYDCPKTIIKIPKGIRAIFILKRDHRKPCNTYWTTTEKDHHFHSFVRTDDICVLHSASTRFANVGFLWDVWLGAFRQHWKGLSLWQIPTAISRASCSTWSATCPCTVFSLAADENYFPLCDSNIIIDVNISLVSNQPPCDHRYWLQTLRLWAAGCMLGICSCQSSRDPTSAAARIQK